MLAALGNGLGAVLSRKAYAVAAAAHQNIDAPTAAYQRLLGGLGVAAICLLAVRGREVAAQFTDAQAPKLPSAEKWRRAWPWVLANSFAGQTSGSDLLPVGAEDHAAPVWCWPSWRQPRWW